MRVVSLVPSLTQTLIDLGRSFDIVGRTSFCPEIPGVKDLGGPKSVDLKALHALEPDLVVLCKEENDKKQAQEIMKRWPAFVDDSRTPEDAIATVRELGQRTNANEAAQMWEESCRAELETLAASRIGEKPVKAAYVVWREPLMSVNGDTYIHHMMALAGFENVLAGAKDRYPTTSLDELESHKPDVYLLPNEPFYWKRSHLAEFPKGKGSLVHGEFFCWQGTYLLKGARAFMDRGYVREK